MLKHYPSILLLPALFLTHVGTGQVINQGNFTPSVGEQFPTHLGNYINPGQAPSMNWNYAALTAPQAVTIQYMTPATTGYGSSFPGATIAGATGAGQYVFYEFNATGMYLGGVRTNNGNVTMVYQDPEKQIAFPCDQNASWNDTFSSSYVSGGINSIRSGTTVGTGQAVGTLVMPYGSIPNVLRIRVEQTMTDVFGGLSSMDTHTISYAFLKPGIHFTILSLADQTITGSGLNQNTKSSQWLDQSAVGIAEAIRNSIGIDVFPNPANDHAVITFSSTGQFMELAILDGTGRVVRNEQLDGRQQGIGQHELDLSRLPAGLYMLRLTDALGQQGVKRLVVQ